MKIRKLGNGFSFAPFVAPTPAVSRHEGGPCACMSAGHMCLSVAKKATRASTDIINKHDKYFKNPKKLYTYIYIYG